MKRKPEVQILSQGHHLRLNIASKKFHAFLAGMMQLFWQASWQLLVRGYILVVLIPYGSETSFWACAADVLVQKSAWGHISGCRWGFPRGTLHQVYGCVRQNDSKSHPAAMSAALKPAHSQGSDSIEMPLWHMSSTAGFFVGASGGNVWIQKWQQRWRKELTMG